MSAFEDILALLFGPSAESVSQYERARAAQEQWAKMVAAENFALCMNFLTNTCLQKNPGEPSISGRLDDDPASA